MVEPIISIESIKRSARGAVDRAMPVTVCPYPVGSEAAQIWKVEHAVRELYLSGVLVTVGEYE